MGYLVPLVVHLQMYASMPHFSLNLSNTAQKNAEYVA